MSGIFKGIVLSSGVLLKYSFSKCFTILADETSDISSIEQFALCIRYFELTDVNNFKIVEHFLKFVPVESTSGQNLADVLLTTLNSCGSLNLALSNAGDVVPIRNSFGVIEKVYTFFNTPKRQIILKNQIQLLVPDINKIKLVQLCPTRWIERHDSIIVFNQLLLPVVAALEEIQSRNCKDSSSAYTLPISKILQTTDIDLSTAVNQVESVVSIFRRLRSNADNEFKQLFLEAQEVASCNTPSKNIEEYYRRSIFIALVDSFLNSLSDRFLKHKNLLTSYKCILPTGRNPTDEQISSFKNLFDFYEKDMQQISFSVAKAEFELCISTAERSFSTLRRIKTYLRNTMGQSLLNGLANLHIHREIQIKESDVLKILSEKGPRKLKF
ncbi:unnamed protein product [Macrosiphum euphorbiae]|uniref:HAT C-terminal dimerisation domain-containing protein n=1 Tax=Macrosiphum euphorbiae TaxID=13131 RepID=A0AAV0WUW0_9HEMI|nr:unnamed protein product [Macrosiphum euphorbiae]